MDELSRYPSGSSLSPGSSAPRDTSSASLIDVLDRVLDKGVVIAGDIKINLLDIELLTIKIRLLIASADKAKEMGIDWWAHDPQLSSKSKGEQDRLEADKQNKALRERVEKLEAQLKALTHNGQESRGERAGGRRG
jgi:hypothetical protein